MAKSKDDVNAELANATQEENRAVNAETKLEAAWAVDPAKAVEAELRGQAASTQAKADVWKKQARTDQAERNALLKKHPPHASHKDDCDDDITPFPTDPFKQD